MTHSFPAALPPGVADPLSAPPRPGNFTHDRWVVLQLVKDTARALEIGEREIAVLAAHLSVLPKGPVRSDQLLMSFAEVSGILERANCMDERRFRRGETRLTEIGLLARKLSGNGRRYPVRNGRGQIVDAYGIDLRPLFLRVPELLRLRAVLAEETARRRSLKSRISARLSELRRSFGQDPLPGTLATALADIQRLCRRTKASSADLIAAEQRLEQAHAAHAAPVTPPSQKDMPDTPPDDAGQTVRHIESPKKEIHTYAKPLDLTTLWHNCPKVAAYFADPPESQTVLARYIFDFLGFIGLDQTSMASVASKAPPDDLLRMLEYLMSRLAKIGNPAAYFKAMLAKFEAGEAVAGNLVRRGRPAL